MRLRSSRRAAVVGAAALALLGAAAVPATAMNAGKRGRSPAPTVVLVHGAWADSSSWAPVMRRLRHDGYPVRAIANPLQGLTNAATAVADVRSLVYIAGFIPAKGETIGELAAKSTPALPLISTPVPGGTEVVIDPAKFRDAFAGDVDKTTAANLATTQRPANTDAVTDASPAEGFRTIPSWALVTRQDHAINPDLQRFMTARANARTTEVDASHAVVLSRPDAVTRVIEQAAR